MHRSEVHADAAPLRLGPVDRVRGVLGAAVIGMTLLGVRLWARLTGTPYLED